MGSELVPPKYPARLRDRINRSAFAIGVLFAFGFTLLHFIAVPIGITYDGLQYIHLADVIGSSHFVQQWVPPRAPLFPLTMKVAFWLVGRHALAPTLVSTTLGLTAVFFVGVIARRLCNARIGALAIVLATMYPTSVAYQHFVLTEAGTSFFLSALTVCLLSTPRNARNAWWKTAILALILSCGYYWRETVQTLAIITALLHVLIAIGHAAYSTRSGQISVRKGVLAAQFLTILLVPYAASSVWTHIVDTSIWKKMAFRQGLFRQAFVPPEDTTVVAAPARYRQAIRESLVTGNFYSGLRSDLLVDVLDKSASATAVQDPQRQFVRGLYAYPGRYISAAARTAALFIGLPGALESENRIFRDQVLAGTGSAIGDGPAEIRAEIAAQFHQRGSHSAVLTMLRALTLPYDRLIIVGSLLTVGGFLYGCVRRDLGLITVCAMPLCYVAFYVAILDSIDRYALPVYPAVLANCVIVPCRIVLGSRRNNLHGTTDAPPV